MRFHVKPKPLPVKPCPNCNGKGYVEASSKHAVGVVKRECVRCLGRKSVNV